MSWQPGDVSPEARRAAEAAAGAAGVPLKDWLAEAVREAIIRELGQIPAEPEPEPIGTAEPPAASKEIADLETIVPEPVAAGAEPAPIAEPEPLMAVPAAAEEPPAPAAIAEPEPLTPEPIAAAEPPAMAPETPGRAIEARAADRPTRGAEPQRLVDRGFSTWLETRIEGLPTRATAATSSIAGDVQPIAPVPVPAPPTPEPPLRPRGPAVATVPVEPVSSAASLESAQPKSTPHTLALPLSLPTGPVMTLPLASLHPARIRARRPMESDPAIAALAASVASQGVREPILVRRLAETADQCEVVAGERRRLAAERAGRADLPAVIVEADDAETLLLSLTENLGRGDFSPLDEARTYLRLLTEHRVSPIALAQRLARERSHIALALRLLGLPPTVRQLIDSGRLGPAQAFTLLAVGDPEAMAEEMMDAAGGGAARGSA